MIETSEQVGIDRNRPALTVESVECEFEGGVRRLRFASHIERMFKRESAPERLRLTTITAIAAVILYNLFLVVDWQALRDQFETMVVLRLFVFSPMIITALVVSNKLKGAVYFEWIGTLGVIIGVACPMIAVVFSHSPSRLTYQYGTLLTMMFCTVIQRQRFRQAVVALLIVMVIQFTALVKSEAFDTETLTSISVFFVTACILLLLSSYLLEQSDRRVFLFALRGRLLHDRIVEGARRDALTNLFNRKYLLEVEGRIWTDAKRFSVRVSAIMIDIDHFKTFNDSYGHLRGDECLRTIGAMLAATLKGREAFAFRFGGEEMLVLMPGADSGDAARVADVLRDEIHRLAIPHPALGPHSCVTASFGITCGLAPDIEVNDLIAAADRALYAAKRDGRDCIRTQADVHSSSIVPAARQPSIVRPSLEALEHGGSGTRLRG